MTVTVQYTSKYRSKLNGIFDDVRYDVISSVTKFGGE